MHEVTRTGLGRDGMTTPPRNAPSMTEVEWQAQVVQLAHTLGWHHLHVRRSIGKGKLWTTATNVVGWPDLFLWHPRHGFAAIELKVGSNKPTQEQLDVLDALATAGAATLLAYPHQLPLVAALLQGKWEKAAC